MLFEMSEIRNIAYLTATDPLDKRSWSGIYYRMLIALKDEFEEVTPIGPIKLPIIFFILKVFRLIIKTTTGKRYDIGHSILLSRIYAFTIKRKLAKKKYDAIFAPTSSTLVAYLNVDIPIFYFSDATVRAMIDYYDGFSKLHEISLQEANKIEKKTIEKSKASIFASDWAANSAISFYKAIPEKTYVVKMGANIDENPIFNIEKKQEQATCNLLFIGVDWNRKGGDIAFSSFLKLLDDGLNVNFIVCGCIPPVKHQKMKVYPFLNKNKKEDYDTFKHLLEDAHFLLLPTRAECAGIVFCEASANGIPSITTDTGGVSSYVKNNINGFTLPLTADANEYASIILKIFQDKHLYNKLAEQSRNEYLKELNWDCWGKQIKEIFNTSKQQFLDF
jgi:glycosyltransferase involved in cell wall biosynthesis